MYYLLIFPGCLLVVVVYAAADSWWQKRHPAPAPPPRTSRYPSEADAITAAEQLVHTTYDTWYQADDHPATLHRLPTP